MYTTIFFYSLYSADSVSILGYCSSRIHAAARYRDGGEGPGRVEEGYSACGATRAAVMPATVVVSQAYLMVKKDRAKERRATKYNDTYLLYSTTRKDC